MTFDSSLDDEREFVSVWYYGDPGSGKTTNVAAGANLGKAAIFPIEPGIKRTALEKRGINTSNIVPIRGVTSSSGIEEMFWKFKSAFIEDKNAFSMIGFDSMTDLVRRETKAFVNELNEKKRKEAERRGEKFKPSRELDWSVLGPQISDGVGDFAEHYHDLPVHLAYTSHVRDDQDGSGGVKFGPAVTPGVKKVLDAWCDILMFTRQVGRYDDGRLVFIGTTAEGGKYQVKDRTSMLPSPHLVNPTMERIVGYFTGELTVETDPEQQEFQTWNENRKKGK